MWQLRRVVGDSMLPTFHEGQILLVSNKCTNYQPGQVVIVAHDGRQKLKRIERINDGKIFVVGDNAAHSTDSRTFGWLDRQSIQARVIWPNV